MNTYFILSLSVGSIVAIALPSLFLLTCIILYAIFSYPKLWFKSLFSGAHISTVKLFGMRLRKVDANKIVGAYISFHIAEIKITLKELETFILAGGSVENLIKAITIARDAELNLSLKVAKSLELSGKDIVSRVQNIITPITVKTNEITAVSKDGMELKLQANVCVKGNIHRIIGVADIDAVIARTEEAVATTVGSAVSYKVVIENPDLISKTVEQMNLDFETAYQVVSVEITRVEVLENISEKNEIIKAESESKISKSKSEEIMAQALAEEQQKKVKIQDMRARLLEAESEIPKLMAKSIADGKFGALDYFDSEKIKRKMFDEPKQLETEKKFTPSANYLALKQARMARSADGKPNPNGFPTDF